MLLYATVCDLFDDFHLFLFPLSDVKKTHKRKVMMTLMVIQRKTHWGTNSLGEL